MNEGAETKKSDNAFGKDTERSVGECLSLAFKYLSYRNRSVFEVRTKLTAKEVFTADVIDDTIDKLVDEGYLNDHTFAEELLRHRTKTKNWGRLKIRADLKRYGVERDIIEAVINALSTEEESSTAMKALTKWLRVKGISCASSAEISTENKLKAMRHLASRGFTTDLIRQTLDNISEK